MYKITIVNEVTGETRQTTIESSIKDSWLNKHINKDSWGKKERVISEEDLPEELRSRILSTEVVPEQGEKGSPALYDAEGNLVMEEVAPSLDYKPEQTLHTVKADYVITETNLNLSKTFRNEQKKESRKAEYPSLEEILHVIMDHGMDSQEMADLQAARQAVKTKYPFES